MDEKQVTDLIQSVAKDAVAAYVKEAGLSQVDQRFMVVPVQDAGGLSEAEQLKQTQKENFGKMAKAIWTKQLAIAEQLNTQIKTADPNNMTTDGDGGYLVPDGTSAEIIGLIPTFGQARGLVDVGTFPRTIDNLNVPKRGTGMTVYYPGEAGSITTSKLALSIVTMVAKKAAGLAVLTDELKSFSIVDFVDYIKTRAAEAFGQDEDSKVFSKVNTVFTGLFYPDNAYGATRNADPSALTYEDIMWMLYAVDQKYLANAKFLCHRSIVESLRGIKDQNGTPIFVMPNAAVNVPTLAGYPLQIIEQTTAKADLVTGDPFLLLGNYKYSMIKDKKGMRIDQSTEAVVDASSLFQLDLSAIRFIRHWSFHPGLPEAYVALEKAGV